MMLAKLRMEVLNPFHPLTILDPTHINKEKKIKNLPPTVPPAPPLPPIPPRDHFDLTDLGQATRLGLADAMSKGNRYFHLNSRLGSCKTDKGLGGTDIVTFFHPFLRKLKHIDAINSETPGYDPAVDAAWIVRYKERVKQYILQQMTEVIIHNVSRVVFPPAIHVVDEPQLNVAKRQRVPEPQGDILALNKKRTLTMQQASYMDIDDEDVDAAPPQVILLSPLERASVEYDLYMNIKISPAMQGNLTTPSGLIKYWMTSGAKQFPVMAVVALAQLGTPPGSGVLENDFSSFANLVTRHRALLDPAMIEMT
jgi:hypothetical protein